MRNPLLQQYPPFIKLIFLILIVLVCLLFTLLLGMIVAIPIFGVDVISALTDVTGDALAENIPVQKYMQIISQVGTFILPALIFALLVNRRIGQYLHLNIPPRITTLILSIMLIMSILPLINWLMVVNGGLRLPEFLSGIEEWMRNSEEIAMQLTEAFLQDTSWLGLSINLVMIAVLAAVGEELLFRGVLIRLFTEWFKSTHLAIWVSAILFSALHLQFFGFLPRMVLGLVLGYLFVWSRSLWVPIITHMFNNASAVIIAFLYYRGSVKTDMESFGSTDKAGFIVLSFIITIVLLALVYYYEKRRSVNLQ